MTVTFKSKLLNLAKLSLKPTEMDITSVSKKLEFYTMNHPVYTDISEEIEERVIHTHGSNAIKFTFFVVLNF